MPGQAWEQLETSGLLPTGFNAAGDAMWYVDMDNPLWQDDLKDTLKVLGKHPSKVNDIAIYQRCAASTKRGEVDVFYPLGDFDFKDGKFTTSLRVKLNLVNVEKALVYKAGNLPILRMYMMGDETLSIWCPWNNEQIDSLVFDNEPPFNIWEQHHFKVVNRNSIQKEGSDPGEILRSTDFREPSQRSRMAIEDMMRTVFLGPSAHKIIHNRWNNSDVTNYQNEQLPWALRNQANYDTFVAYLMVNGYDVFPAYDVWMNSLKLTAADLNQ